MADSFEAIALRESKLRIQWLPMKTAVQEIVAFEKLFGEGHLLLACHAALPSLLTVELLHFMRLNFLDRQPRAPWIAEMDFLLSSLCRQIEDDLFEVEPMVREALLFKLQERYGWGRLLDVASFLLEYLHKRQESRQNPGVAQLHEWIAQAYLEPDKVIEELTKQLDESLDTEQNAYQTLPKKLQVARAMELLAEPLERTTLQEKYSDLLHGTHVLAYVLYENKEKIRATLLYTAKQASDEPGKRLFSPAMQRWLATIAGPQVEAREDLVTEVTRPAQDDVEEKTESEIDKWLRLTGWAVVRDNDEFQTTPATGIAIREFPLMNNKLVDYLLVINDEAVGIIEVKGEDIHTVFALSPDRKSVTISTGSKLRIRQIPTTIRFARTQLPFSYEINGYEIQFTNHLDPEARSRRVFYFHRPETLAQWLQQAPIGTPNELNDLLRSRLRRMPPVNREGLSNRLYEATSNLEKSLAENRPRTLIQMATGSGKTYLAVHEIYRLLRFGGARRILYLVDRATRAQEVWQSFQHYVSPDIDRSFSQHYQAQVLHTNHLDSAVNVCIATIQRLQSLLLGRYVDNEITYNPNMPIEAFDVIVLDECHRSFYGKWRSAIEYFDAFIIGLTAIVNDRTFAYFNRNLVYEYSWEQAVEDGVIVNYDIYRVAGDFIDGEMRLSEGNVILQHEFRSSIQKYRGHQRYTLGKRQSRLTVEQIREVLITYHKELFEQLFPGRTEVPKTIIFADNQRDADIITQQIREVFEQSQEFVEIITEQVNNTRSARSLENFRFGYYPRIVVTVNMLWGVNIKPVECIVLLRPVQSRDLFEQIVGMGCRTISDAELHNVTPDAKSKTHFVLVDAVGVTDSIRTISGGYDYTLPRYVDSNASVKESFNERINRRFATWLENQQRTRGQPFTEEQIRWLERIRDRVITHMKFDVQDFNRSPFEFDGGLVAAHHLFGEELTTIIRELNRMG